MGVTTSFYKSNEKEIYDKMTNPLTKRTKRDGTILRSKEQIMESYDKSILPWPLKPIWKLDYCWRVNYMMYKHSCVLAFPIAGIHFIWVNQPAIWKMNFKTFPKLLFAINYTACVLLMTAGNLFFSVMFEPYW